MEKSEVKAKVYRAVAWGAGIFLILAGLSGVFVSPAAGLLILLAGLLLLPPSYQAINAKLKGKLTRNARFIAVVMLIVVGGALLPENPDGQIADGQEVSREIQPESPREIPSDSDKSDDLSDAELIRTHAMSVLEKNAHIDARIEHPYEFISMAVFSLTSEGYPCDTVNAIVLKPPGETFVVVCNRRDYRYRLENIGGTLQITPLEGAW